MTKKGLGQGVGLLFRDTEEKYFECQINSIKPNKHQPRLHFKEDGLESLAASIKENGVIQPLIVTHTDNSDTFELVAGERRLRAAKIAGLTEVPVVLMKVDNEDTLLELALIENIQRTDLNPVEEAQAYQKLIKKFSYTQEEAANRVGKKRSTVTNLLRLLKLPRFIREDLIEGVLSEGHGRALVKLVDDPVKIQETRDTIVKTGLSVRQTEKIVRKLITVPKSLNKSLATQNKDDIPQSYKKALTNQLTNCLNSKVVINQNGNRGKIEIDYYSLDDLERLINLLVNEK